MSDSFGSTDAFKDAFKAAGLKPVRIWLVLVGKNSDGRLAVTKTENGVNPLCFGQKLYLVVTFGNIHTILIRNKRPDYLTNFLENLVNWDYVAAQL